MKLNFIGYRSNALKTKANFIAFRGSANYTDPIAADTYSVKTVQSRHAVQ